MSTSEDYRWPVRAVNTATGAVRTFRHMPRFVHVGWVVSLIFYAFIGAMQCHSDAEFAAWEIIFGLIWTIPWSIGGNAYNNYHSED